MDTVPVVEGDHWVRWHQGYDDPASSLSRRLAIVQRRLRDALTEAPEGELRLASMCAGDGRDVIGVLADHPRRDDVQAMLVELDPNLAATARRLADGAGLSRLRVIEGDASSTAAYADLVPVDTLLVCGVFGNISDRDIQGMISELPSLLNPAATVLWTRHRLPPDLTPAIRSWFDAAGFREIAFDSEEGFAFGVGTARFAGAPRELGPDRRLFTFVGDGTGAKR